MVLKNFEILEISEDNCICHSSKRFNKFQDCDASENTEEEEGNRDMVRMVNLSILQYKGLK